MGGPDERWGVGPVEAQAIPTRLPAGEEDTVRRVLTMARTYLGMDAAWLSERHGEDEVLTHVEAADGGTAPAPALTACLADSCCLRALDGPVSLVVPDTGADTDARVLAITDRLGIRAYVGVPVRSSDGTVHGTLRCISRSPQPQLAGVDLRVVEMLAGFLGELFRQDDRQAALDTVRQRTTGAIGGQGRSLVLQPIVDVPTGVATGVEALARFDSPQTADVWFAQAEPVGLRLPLEMAAARTALAALERPGHSGYLSLNLSAEAIVSDGFPALMAVADPSRLVVEITEHAVVEDYDVLSHALRRYRDAGLRLAVDDAGAGYASLRHILKLRPDFIKIDLSLVRDIHKDPARQALVDSLASFARTLDAVLVAEGVEQQGELDMLVRLGVRQMQGYLLCPPCEDPPTSGFPVPSRHVRPDRRAIPA
jgi:EAL domain-containing protein (putative c-di-GMP-specific phosphodiesterase class I)